MAKESSDDLEERLLKKGDCGEFLVAHDVQEQIEIGGEDNGEDSSKSENGAETESSSNSTVCMLNNSGLKKMRIYAHV